MAGSHETANAMQKKMSARKRKLHRASRELQNARPAAFSKYAKVLAEIGRSFYGRGWVLGTSGNFSAVVSRYPLRLAITSTGLDKGNLAPAHFLEMDAESKIIRGNGRPSAEALLHLAIVRGRQAGAVLHTHSVWGTVLSGAYASKGGVTLEGYEMLKGLEGVRTHQHREWLPILENSQNMAGLAESVSEILHAHPSIHGFLLREHGLYTWGAGLQEAKRHVEILEFLMEVVVRSRDVAKIS